MSNKAILIGGGAFARELLSWAEAACRAGQGVEVVGYVDDAGPVMDGYAGVSVPCLGTISDLRIGDAILLCAVGAPDTKRKLAERYGVAAGRWGRIIHPSAVITDNAILGEGIVIGPQCYVANHARIGDLVAVNSFCGVGHDVQVGHFATISSGIDLMGGVVVEDDTFIGSGARILPGVRVGTAARIGAGSIVMRQVKPGKTVFAAPAKTL